MQNAAGTRLGDCDQPSGTIHESPPSQSCPRKRCRWFGIGDVGAMECAVTVVVVQHYHRDVGQQPLEGDDRASRLGPLSIQRAQPDRVLLPECSRTNAAQRLEMCTTAQLLAEIVCEGSDVETCRRGDPYGE